MEAVVEFLCRRLLLLASDEAANEHAPANTVVKLRHIRRAVENDPAFCRLLKDVILPAADD